MISVYAAFNDPLGRIAKGDVEVNSIFYNKLSNRINHAINEGYMKVVENRRGKKVVRLTTKGYKKYKSLLLGKEVIIA